MRSKFTDALLLVLILAVQSWGLNFKQVASFPFGVVNGYIKGIDANHDGYEDLVFTTFLRRGDSARVVYFGYRPFNQYIFEDSIGPPSLFWDIGDLDGDSLLDVLVQRWDIYPTGIRVFEPLDYWSFPKVIAWSWQFEYIGNGSQAMYIADLDRDSLKEMLTADANVIYVFENRGNNQFAKVFSDTAPSVPVGFFATGDFDGDGWMEFAWGDYAWDVFVYECTGSDQYRLSWRGPINTANMIDAISLPDIDGDGRLEFAIGSLRTGGSPWAGKLHIFETTGNDQFANIFEDSVLISDRGGYLVHSDCGDVDQDGWPELVWAIDRDWMVYKSPGNNQFQRVFSAYGDNGRWGTHISIHDMNGNGYPEIIESGTRSISGWTYSETHIWEVVACQLVYPNGGETLYCDTSYTIRWRNVSPFVADSFSLFFSADSSRTYSLIAHGIPGSDSTYAWTVPDTLSDTCFIMLWAYQNATGWDFSDGPFRIRDGTGVEVPSVISLSPCLLVPLSVVPNPFVSFARTPGHEKESFALYDVSGRKVGVFKGDRIGSGLSAGIYFIKPEDRDAKPLRIVKLR